MSNAAVSKGRLIPAAILAILVYGIIAAMLGTLLPELGDTFGLSGEEKGSVAFMQSIGLIIASISVGPLIDNKGKKAGLLLGLFLIAASLFALPNSSKGTLGVTLLVLGLGGGIIVTAANALVSDISPEKRGSTLNLLNLFFGLGGFLTPFIASNFLAGNNITLCYLAAGLTTATLILHATTPMPGPSGERGFKANEIGAVAGRPVLWLLALSLFLYVACEVGVWNWLVNYLVKTRGMEKGSAQNILSYGFALGILLGRVAVSRVLINVRPATVTLASSVLMAITTYGMMQTTDPTMTGAMVFLAGIAMAPVFPTTLAMVGDVFTKATATAMGIVITCGWIGLAVSSKIIGSIAGADEANLTQALLVLPAFSVAMILVNLALRPMMKRA